MIPSGDPSITERLGEWVASVELVDVPARVLELARHQRASVAAAIHAGAESAEARAVERALARHAPPGPVTVLPSGERWALDAALTLNSARSMALDHDDYLYLGHTGHSAVLASLAVCEQEQLGPRAQLLAQVVANEVAGRVGASVVLGPQNGQAWSFIHAAGAAAATAKLLRLDATRAAHAIAIALYQPTFTLWPGFMGPGSKVLTAAGPSTVGVQAAYCAAEGLTGARELFEHRRKGFWRFFAFVPVRHVITGLGTTWVTDTLAFKRYPGCAYIDTTIDAVLAILGEHRTATGSPLAVADVERVDVAASLLTVEMDNLSAEHARARGVSPVHANFSIPVSVALAILGGRLTSYELSPEYLDAHEATIRALAARVSLRHDWSATFDVAEAFDGTFGASSVAARLRPRDWLRVARGYARELGGARSHGLDLRALAKREHRSRLARLARSGRRHRAEARRSAVKPDLANVDLTHFRMAFPAAVTLITRDGRRYHARQVVPVGAPGEPGRLEAVRAKVAVEVGSRLGGAAADRVCATLATEDPRSLEELVGRLRGVT
ncbi:MAG: MmgE/PrpD family protein [Deltaproteobacteria bacterium]|nr:MmgE/PrpD family protein [Deltaproteobacteria bacterium]